MNRSRLKKEGKKWVQDGIITEDQFEEILQKYIQKDQSYLLILFAVLLMSIGILIFVFSDWAQVPAISRIIMMSICMLALYAAGHYFYTKSTAKRVRKTTSSI